MIQKAEIFPVVNENGEVVGKATRAECHSGAKLLHPVVHLHVYNEAGELYLQKRSETKDIQPGKWDTAVGGHVDYGETVEKALRREACEELGIVDFKTVKIASYIFESDVEKEFVNTYKTVYSGEIKIDGEEISEGGFWSVEKIRENLENNIFTPNFVNEFKQFLNTPTPYRLTPNYMKTKMKKTLPLLVMLLLLLSTSYLHASDKPVVYKIDIKKEINKTTQIYLNKGLEEAQKLNAEAVLIHMNTYGGLLEAADSMRTAILYSPVPVYVFIDNNAASAGALISIACRKIFMRKGASIGAATVVGQTGEQMPDKYQSYMRAMMRATAEAHGKDTVVKGYDTVYKWIRDPKIAEAMVDDRSVIPNLIDSGKTLTLTSEEAVKWGYCEGIAESVDDVIVNHLNISEYKLEAYQPTWLDNLMGFLMNPFFQSILIMIIIGGIYFEMQTPGIGFPSVAALIAAVLYFSPLYIEGLAANWEILIFVIGLILIAFEVFVIPGFGIAGISGTVCVIAGLTLALINNVNFDFKGVSGFEIGRSLLVVFIGLTLGFGGMLWLTSKIGTKGIMRQMALVTDLENATSSPVLTGLVGKTGVAATVLRPSGKVIIDGEYYDGVSESGFIEKGLTVSVVRFENAQVYVVAV